MMYINVPIYGTFFIVMKGVFIMAVNEQIVTGRKFRKLIDEANKLWQRISFWTKASDVEFNDGKNAETKFGAINGVTDSLTSTVVPFTQSAGTVIVTAQPVVLILLFSYFVAVATFFFDKLLLN